jgi:hypothetical protein
MKRSCDIWFRGRPGGAALPFGRLGEPALSDFAKPRPRGWICAPLSQAEDSTQASGSENRMPGTARPRVRIRDNRPGSCLLPLYYHGYYIESPPSARPKG